MISDMKKELDPFFDLCSRPSCSLVWMPILKFKPWMDSGDIALGHVKLIQTNQSVFMREFDKFKRRNAH